eukprot:4056328-Pleurochrysis_carterae.AAC.1
MALLVSARSGGGMPSAGAARGEASARVRALTPTVVGLSGVWQSREQAGNSCLAGRPSVARMSSLTSFSIHLQSHGNQGAGSASSRAVAAEGRPWCRPSTQLRQEQSKGGRGVCAKQIGDARAPQSAGCSKMNSAPALCAARSRAVRRRTISLACVSSR